MIIRVDIDDTICEYKGKREYNLAIPIQENIDKINRLYDEGNYIIYWTARGTTTGLDWYNLTLKQLKEWECKFHDLKMSKPEYDLLIDDKNMRIEEI